LKAYHGQIDDGLTLLAGTDVEKKQQNVTHRKVFTTSYLNGNIATNSNDDIFKQPLPPCSVAYDSSTPVIPLDKKSVLSTPTNEDNSMTVKSVMTAFPQAFFGPLNSPFPDIKVCKKGPPKVVKPAEHAEEINLAPKNAVKNTNRLQSEYINAIITETIDDFSIETRKKLWHMEWNSTKNFEIMKNEQMKLGDKVDDIDRKLDKLISFTMKEK